MCVRVCARDKRLSFCIQFLVVLVLYLLHVEACWMGLCQDILFKHVAFGMYICSEYCSHLSKLILFFHLLASVDFHFSIISR